MNEKYNTATQDNRIKVLYQKYIDRTCNESELEELFGLLQGQDDWKDIREVLRTTWDHPGRIEELSSLDWDTFRNGVDLPQTVKNNEKRLRLRRLSYISIAASILLMVGIGIWSWMQREILVEYKTGYGEVEEIVLNDDTRVRLNANSTLYWDSNWKRRGVRNVRIEGEAFFNVAHHDGDRFYVSTQDLTVMVTGTAFNVTSRRDETRVFLESGEVFLELNREEGKVVDGHTTSEKSGEMLRMVPGEQLSYSSKSNELIQKENLSVEEAASWKTGELIFKDIPLKDVLLELSDVYGKSFIVEDSTLFERKIDGGMPYEDWETVKGLMKFMINAEILETGNKVTIK